MCHTGYSPSASQAILGVLASIRVLVTRKEMFLFFSAVSLDSLGESYILGSWDGEHTPRQRRSLFFFSADPLTFMGDATRLERGEHKTPKKEKMMKAILRAELFGAPYDSIETLILVAMAMGERGEVTVRFIEDIEDI